MTAENTKTYFELSLPVSGFNADRLSGLLHQAGCLGIFEASPDEWIVYLPDTWHPEDTDQLMISLKAINQTFDPEECQFEKLPYQDWNAEWRKFFKPLEIIDNLWVRPPWETQPDLSNAEEIIIDPQMAFGTGHHETTRLMMEAMQKIELNRKTVLDLGTGSGILAIFAQMRGAARVLGIDIDPVAIENAHHNLKLNNKDHIEYAAGDIALVGRDTFPVILANIQYHILSDITSALIEALIPGGKLIVSGILIVEDVPRLKAEYEAAGLSCVDQINLNEWAVMIWEKPFE